MPRVKVVIKRGEISWLESPELTKLAKDVIPADAELRRVSHVEPRHFWLRIAFHAIRWLFGDCSAAADWTRTWTCRWRVNFGPVGGPIYYDELTDDEDGRLRFVPFRSREAAIKFEIPYAEQILQGRDPFHPHTNGAVSC